MTECPICEKPFRGYRCPCGYEPLHPPPAYQPAFQRADTPEEMEHRRMRLAEIKNLLGGKHE